MCDKMGLYNTQHSKRPKAENKLYHKIAINSMDALVLSEIRYSGSHQAPKRTEKEFGKTLLLCSKTSILGLLPNSIKTVSLTSVKPLHTSKLSTLLTFFVLFIFFKSLNVFFTKYFNGCFNVIRLLPNYFG